MLVMYINKNQIKIGSSKQILRYKDKQIINPREEDLIEAGYKELIIQEEPIYNEDSQYLQPCYIEQEDKIIQKWEVKEIEEVEDETNN